MTSNQVINTDDIQNKSNVSLNISNDKKITLIKLDNNRLIYTNEKLDITIIEILLYKYFFFLIFIIINY